MMTVVMSRTMVSMSCFFWIVIDLISFVSVLLWGLLASEEEEEVIEFQTKPEKTFKGNTMKSVGSVRANYH